MPGDPLVSQETPEPEKVGPCNGCGKTVDDPEIKDYGWTPENWDCVRTTEGNWVWRCPFCACFENEREDAEANG